MFKINDKDLKALEADLKHVAERALPFATKATLNKTAFDTRKIALNQIQGKMIQRNRFTAQSIRVDMAKTLNIARQEAVIGSTADYMETQEFGGTKRAQGAKSVAIATKSASGEGAGAGPRRKLPRRANQLKNIRLRRTRKAKTRKQRNVFAVQDAVTSGKRYVFMDLGRRQGIFKVIGGRKNFKRGWPKGAKLKMMHDMSHKSVRIPKNPWLAPSVTSAEKLLEQNYRNALEFQLKRLRLLGR